MQKLANRLLDSSRVRALWQSKTGRMIVGLMPRSFRQCMKAFYRTTLVIPPVMLPPLERTNPDPWDHKKPILSVILPCYNYGQYIHESLHSIKSQTFQDFEIIVVDDGSDDKFTLKVLDDLRREGMKVLRQEKLNVAAALNMGISAACGRYICRLDADDTIEPTYFEKCLCLLECNPAVAFAYSLVRTFGDENQLWLTEAFDLRLLLEYNHICASAVFRKDVWQAVGGFDAVMDGYEDWEFWIRLGRAGFRGKLIPETLFNYRRHGITLNVRSDRNPQKLQDHIRTKHAELFSHPENIREIQKGYFDVHVSKPFLNLNSQMQYSDIWKSQGLLITSSQKVSLARILLQSIPSAGKLEKVIIISTDNTPYEHDEHPSKVMHQVYPLARFLDRAYWSEFVLNLVKTRSVTFVVVSDSKPAYELTPILKEFTSAFILDFIQDMPVFHLSARYDRFIDFHVTFSEKVSALLVGQFGVPAKKTILLPSSSSSSIRGTFEDVLRTATNVDS